MENLKGKRENTTEMAFSSYASYLSTLERNVFRCSFCKKEFRSAQALGGHMNVHRRDRAKKKLFPSSSHESLHKSPNPNLISSSSSSAVSLLPSPSLPFPSVRAPFCKDNVEKKASVNSTMSSFQHGDHPVMKRREVGVNSNKRALVDVEVRELPAVLGKRVECSLVRMKKDVVKLDLSMDSMGGAKDDLDLDLELRLGRS